MMIILGQGDDVTLGGDLQAAATADLDIWTFEFGEQRAVALEDGDVEPIAVRIADQNVAGVRNVDPVREVGDILAANAPQKLPLL